MTYDSLSDAAAMSRGDGPARAARLPTPGVWSGRSWAELLYLLIDFPLAIGTFVVVMVLIAVGVPLSVIYLGVPLGLAGLLLARVAGALRRGMAAGLLGHSVPAPGRTPRRRTGAAGALLDAATDRIAWRAVGYHAIRLAASPLSLLAVVLWATAFGSVSYPLWREYLPAQRGADGAWHRGMSFGSGYFVDTSSRMTLFAVVGVILLILTPLLVRGLTTMERRLAAWLLGPAGAPRA